jgi:hypothetical protein
MDSHVAEFQASSWERLDVVESALTTRVEALKHSLATCGSWRPFIEYFVGFNNSSMEALRADILRIAAHVELPPHASILGAYESTGDAHWFPQHTSMALGGTTSTTTVGRGAKGFPTPKVHSRPMVCNLNLTSFRSCRLFRIMMH